MFLIEHTAKAICLYFILVLDFSHILVQFYFEKYITLTCLISKKIYKKLQSIKSLSKSLLLFPHNSYIDRQIHRQIDVCIYPQITFFLAQNVTYHIHFSHAYFHLILYARNDSISIFLEIFLMFSQLLSLHCLFNQSLTDGHLGVRVFCYYK